MPTTAATDCMGCGKTAELLHCDKCALRLKGAGTGLALCTPCVNNADDLTSFGKQIDPAIPGFTCNACVKYLARIEQEKLFQNLQGPSTEKILRTVADNFPWAMEIAKASSEELLDALHFVKRKLSGHRTVSAIAANLSQTNSHAALLIQQMGANLANNGGSKQNELTDRALRTFVKNQCPVVKYKSLLHPPDGSIYKATSHFRDMTRVEDNLVAALAKERLFLCEYMDAKYRPAPSEKQRKLGVFPELPDFALRILRCTLKSLSMKIKNAAAQNANADLMAKAWYSEHFAWATNWSVMQIVAQVPSASSSYQSQSSPSNLLAITPNGENIFTKGKGKEAKGKNQRAHILGSTEDFHQNRPNKVPKMNPPPGGNTQPESKQDFDKLINATTSKPNHQVIAESFKLFPGIAVGFWRENCRNCFVAGSGLLTHTLFQCQQNNTKCVLPCTKCRNGTHWATQCPTQP